MANPSGQDLEPGDPRYEQVRARLDAWRKSLLDLSRRNKLLYFGEGRGTRVQVANPNIQELYQQIVIDRRSLGFPFVRDVSVDELEVATEEEASQITARVFPGDLDIAPAVDSIDDLRQLYVRLERLRKATRTLSEEQGVHTLFLAVGFLEWKEAPHAQERVRSPLLLLPVELKKEGHRFRLYPHEDDVESNPALFYKLEHDFAISLPSLEDLAEAESGELDPESFFVSVEQQVHRLDWTVLREAWLSQFSFYKLAMYRDLEGPKVVKASATHSVLSVLCEVNPSGSADGVSIQDADRRASAPDGFPVLDADSSQLEVLERVRRGQSLVVQGPPGTGKSQTIVNIIAQAVRQGQHVLFVSEKRAALEVVHRRLKQLGLDRVCLELHSHKANRKAVIDQLIEVAERGRTWGREPDRLAFEDYQKAKVRLDQYVHELHLRRGAIGRTAYEIHGRIAQLESVPLIIAALPVPRCFDVQQEQERELISTMTDLSIAGIWDVANSHPWRDADPIDNRAWIPELVRDVAERLLHAVANLRAILDDVQRTLGLSHQRTIKGARGTQEALTHLMRRPLHQLPKSWLTGGREEREYLRSLAVEGASWQRKVRDARAALHAFRAEAVAENLEAISHLLYELDSTSNRRLLARWRLASRTARQIRQIGGPKLSWSKALSVLRAAHELREAIKWFAQEEQNLAEHFAEVYKGHDTDFGVIEAALQWVESLQNMVSGPVPLPLVDSLAGSGDVTMPVRLDGIVRGLESDIRSAEEAANVLVPLFAQGVAGRPLLETPLDILFEHCASWIRDVARLPEWLSHRRLSKRCDQLGLTPFLEGCRRKGVLGRELPRSLERALLMMWKQEVYNEAPILAEFDGIAHEALIQRFCDLDRRLQHESVQFVLRSAASRIPNPLPHNELLRLQKEAVKKARRLPLRRLLPAIPTILLPLKPCLLMSPLSAAIYLPRELFTFDLVVFDEASQLPPADAIGAILRGRQVIILGDNKQLPPTDFFQAHAESEGEVDEVTPEEATAYESILDIAWAYLPSAMLQWHYRSVDERLIAFSNRRFYEGRLVTFPTPQLDSDDTGVRFAYERQGAYGRGGSRTNVVEAHRVVELIVDHLSSQPKRSLGVIAMSIEQRDAVEHELKRRLRDRPDLVPLASEERDEEPFFIKNLETVQGDERDEIIISIGYGPTEPGGVPTLQFGPLNRQGGERRWNVAVTRARYRTTVVASMRPEQLDGVRQARWEGPRAMAEYLAYADRAGREEATVQEMGEPESPFEQAVMDALRAWRYTVDSQVGSSGFRIDLAVRHPDLPSRYILGIECDGRAYHSSKIARDRDRLRQQVLAARGWTIFRVWSPDWSRDPRSILERIVQRIESLRSGGPPGVYAGNPQAPTHPRGRGDNSPGAEAPSAEPTSGASENSDRSNPSFTPLSMDSAADVLKREFAPYRLYGPGQLTAKAPYQLARYFRFLVGTEGPIHEDLALQRMLELLGYGRRGHRVMDFMKTGLVEAIQSRWVSRRGKFLWPPDKSEVVPRKMSDRSLIGPEFIAPEEWNSAMILALRLLGASSQEEILRGVTTAFGFERITAEVRAQAERAVRKLVKSGVVYENSGLLYLVRAKQGAEHGTSPTSTGASKSTEASEISADELRVSIERMIAQRKSYRHIADELGVTVARIDDVVRQLKLSVEILVCPRCGTKNRTPSYRRLDAVCGRCHTPLVAS